MFMPLGTTRELLAYHYDRRNRVYEFLQTLPAAAFTKPLNVGWRDLRGTLIHCLEAEEFWIQHAVLHRARPDFDPAACPDVAAVKRLADEVRARTEAYVAGLTDADMGQEHLVRYSSGTEVRFTTAKLFLHVITHDAHHRGQVVALARQLGCEPPEIDLM